MSKDIDQANEWRHNSNMKPLYKGLYSSTYSHAISGSTGFVKDKFEKAHRIGNGTKDETTNPLAIGTNPAPSAGATQADPRLAGGTVFWYDAIGSGTTDTLIDDDIDWRDRHICVQTFIDINTLNAIPGGSSDTVIIGGLIEPSLGHNDYATGFFYSEGGELTSIQLLVDATGTDHGYRVDTGGDLYFRSNNANSLSLVSVIHYSVQWGQRDAT